ncbi:39S ribosomal protein L45, mitochondrial [Lunasporangiospora selenospora]|uniref:Large ribosomal subunit protein mL45 n=1 Tax=Lunasporangiospora selenospora TaxID=979761 RepID=A0A9P6G2S4_9FUNG|nr:39S ribosomal protein L45, mitochondrial [Lunasporangiospora selenospora]
MFRTSSRILGGITQPTQYIRSLAPTARTNAAVLVGPFNLAPRMIPQPACYSSVPHQLSQQVSLRDIGVMDPYVIPEKKDRPSLLNNYKSWIKYAKLRMRNTGMTAASTLGMCWRLKDFGITARFLGESEDAYIAMNDAFAKGDRKFLEEMCTSSMFAKLKGQMKDRPGRFEWRYHGIVEKPKIVSIRQGQIGGHVLIQITVRMNSTQSMAVFDKKNKPIAGDLKKSVPVLEYIVFQKYITDPSDSWKIVGKVSPSS